MAVSCKTELFFIVDFFKGNERFMIKCIANTFWCYNA